VEVDLTTKEVSKLVQLYHQALPLVFMKLVSYATVTRDAMLARECSKRWNR